MQILSIDIKFFIILVLCHSLLRIYDMFNNFVILFTLDANREIYLYISSKLLLILINFINTNEVK